ncbi:MAG: DUF6503 family protein [bacterium]
MANLYSTLAPQPSPKCKYAQSFTKLRVSPLRYHGSALLIGAILLTFSLSDCTRKPNAQTIIEAAITTHGGARYTSSVIEFDFRHQHYTVQRHGGLFTYKRIFRDSTGIVEDVLNNEAFHREINGEKIPLSEKVKSSLSSSLNSVVYFALLPYGLNDPAVQKRYLGEASIKGQPYNKVEVTFRQEGGGKDYQDSFVYWIHKSRHTMDYLAYRFHVDGGGTRFRQAINPRTVGGIRFSDYFNYKGLSRDLNIAEYGRLFEAGQVTKVSDIILENVRVKSLSD